MNSLRMSFWMVPASFSGATPCSSAATTYSARIGQHRAVHRHRHRHRRQVDTVEQLPHVQNRIDCHTGHPDITGHPRVIGVVPAVGGQVERHRQTLLPGRQVAPVKRVRLRGRGEPGVLPNRPRLVDIHRRIRPADERRLAGETVHRIARADHRIPVGGDVHRLDVDALRGGPVQLLGRCSRAPRRPPRRCSVDSRPRCGLAGRVSPCSGTSAKLPIGRLAGHAAPAATSDAVMSCPQSGEQGRQRRDRVDLGGQIVVRFAGGVRPTAFSGPAR